MKKKSVFVAVSNQKGGVGKSTMLVALASLLNYTILIDFYTFLCHSHFSLSISRSSLANSCNPLPLSCPAEGGNSEQRK